MEWVKFNQRQDELQQWQHMKNASGDFTDLVAVVRMELTDLYRSEQTVNEKRRLKVEILDSLLRSYEQLIVEEWHGKRYYSSWFESPVNNAKLALYNTYEGSHCAFQALLDRANGNLQEFHRLAEQKSRLKKDQRKAWLKQTCIGV